MRLRTTSLSRACILGVLGAAIAAAGCGGSSPSDPDLDEDGFRASVDCDDTNAAINPDAAEVAYNGADDDCDATTLDDDLDEDGFVAAQDCDDDNDAINPDAVEVTYNGADDDCDATTLDDDLDEDGFVAAQDCDDDDDTIHPDATDVGWDGEDTNCDGRDLGATAASPAQRIRVDAALDGSAVVRLATNESHALVVGVSQSGLGATLSAASDGTSVDVTIGTPGALVPRRVTAFARAGGFGVVYTLPDFGANGWCHVYAHTVSNAGVVGPAVQVTAVVPAMGMAPAVNSAAFCDRDPLGVQGDSDWVFFVQPQGVVAGNTAENAQLVRRTLDLAVGSATLSPPAVFGVNQSNRGGQLLDVVHNGEIAALAYTYTYSRETKLTLWGESGMLNNASNAQVYGGEGVVFAEPSNTNPPVGVRLVGTPFDDVSNTSTFTFSRLDGAAGQRRLERAEVVVTGTGRGTPTVTYAANIGTPTTVTTMLDALGNAGAVGSGASRYTWCAADMLVGAVFGTSDAGVPVDATLTASTPVALVDSRQTATRLVHLVSAAGVHTLITEEP
ncbi:MAG: putative metal-binding motif-containing protein [Sandaracinaceae bacterium]|nr:putative metal-binding motif-containing protein [Sandaracinaceae bacterium]